MIIGPVFFSIIIGILLLLLITGGIYFLVIYFREQEKPEDDAFFINLMPSLTNGHAVGTIKDKKESQALRRTRIFFEPKDLKPTDIFKKNWKMQDIIVETDKLLILPKGTLSSHKSIIIAQPYKSEMMSDYLRNSELGKALIIVNEKQNTANILLEAIREASNRKDFHIKEFAEGEASEQLIKFLDLFYKDRLKKLATETAKTSIIPSAYQQTRHDI